MDQGHKKLMIYRRAHELALKVHSMSLALPSFEMYEEGGQIRRSSKSVSNQIVEGYALRRYKGEYVHYLWRAYASCQETVEHLEMLFETKSLKDERVFRELHEGYDEEVKMLFSFIEAIERSHDPDLYSLREEVGDYGVSEKFDSDSQEAANTSGGSQPEI